MIQSSTTYIVILLLTLSNTFMTFAWYGHLKYRYLPLFAVIFISWFIAFFEYLLQVPANKMGIEVFSLSQLKVIQEIISITTFVIFAIYFMGEQISWNQYLGFFFIIVGAFFSFKNF